MTIYSYISWYCKKLLMPKKLNLYEFTQIKKITDDTYNKIPNSDVHIDFYDNNYKIGYISYRLDVGQIGIFYIEELYRGRGLGTQIFEQTMKEMKENNIKYIWGFTSKDTFLGKIL